MVGSTKDLRKAVDFAKGDELHKWELSPAVLRLLNTFLS
jgi:hypothetical protein